MRVFIHRNLSEESTSVEVTNCTVNPGTFVMKFYGPEASEFYAIVDIIRSVFNFPDFLLYISGMVLMARFVIKFVLCRHSCANLFIKK